MNESALSVMGKLNNMENEHPTHKPPFGSLPIKARAYILCVIILGSCISFFELRKVQETDLFLILLLGIISGLLGIYRVMSSSDISFNIANVLQSIAFIALGLPATNLIILLSNVISWVKRRDRWHVLAFNIGTAVLSFQLASLIYDAVRTAIPIQSSFHLPGILLSFLVYSIIDPLLPSIVIYLIRGVEIRQSDLFTFHNILREFAFMCTGGATVLLWSIHPLAIILTLSPLYIFMNELKVPGLKVEAERDPKTGLLNARTFRRSLQEAFERAERLDRPLSLVMCDLDHMRDVNNTYGHPAGDQVLRDVSRMLRRSFRSTDMVARYGGEEFAIILPGAEPEDARSIVERARMNMEEMRIVCPQADQPIRVTMSFGIASRGTHSVTIDELIENADTALYHAKGNGRNCVGIFANSNARCFIPTSPATLQQQGVKT